jgi:hypothetical protein
MDIRQPAKPVAMRANALKQPLKARSFASNRGAPDESSFASRPHSSCEFAVAMA